MGRVSAVPIPQPRAETTADATRRRAGRSLGIALLLGAAGSAVVLIASGQTWADGIATVAGGSVSLHVGGRDVTGVPAALAIAGLAALVAVFAVRTGGRLLVSALLALSGAGAAVAALVGANDSSALDDEAARTTGDTAATVDGLIHTAWPYVTAAGGVLILLAGLLALRYGSHWPTMSGRYERDGTPRAARVRRPAAGPAKATDPDRPEDIWKALDRGEDPTG
ncbi:TIGR02234 family membrane protein [Streptomyces sp. NBC_01716]|uniref:TIGR02234 family membrane protein n=1 Tax=Streptomyces sp. NBC_01716 TaxID=2975917 RepID=UPI002E36D007|nr:TIGR02234 family membrane protein [Streptomyces sp. NBC_01716]